AIKDDRVVRVGDITDLRSSFSTVDTIDCNGSYLLPGLIDTHLHTESTLLTPTSFTELALPMCWVEKDWNFTLARLKTSLSNFLLKFLHVSQLLQA
ncbi:MAG: hypothetical protein ACW98K_18860, partial [Candidatus Kariarchaeaceae archaeon]